MSYGVMPYAVDTGRISSACGSKDETLLRTLKEQFHAHIAFTDNELRCVLPDEAPSIFTAIDRLIAGEKNEFDGRHCAEGAVYACAYEYIVRFFGRHLDNSLFCPTDLNHLSTTDAKLAAAGCCVQLTDFVSSYSAPVSFPLPEDFPGFGWWNPQDCASSLQALQASKANGPEIAAIKAWLADVTAKNEGVIGFWH